MFKKRPTLRLANFARKRVALGASRRGHLRGAWEGVSTAHHRLIIMRGTVGELDRMHGGAAAHYAAPMTVRAPETDAAIRSSIDLGRNMREVRAIATVDSWGHAHGGQPSQRSDKMDRRFLPGVKAGAPNIMKSLAWMLAPLMALGWVVSASTTVTIHSDPGGRIDQYLDRYNQIRLSGQRVVVDGTCNSACTLLLGSVPRERICFTEQASLGFHSAWQFDDSGRPVASPLWTRVLWRNYPRPIRTWIIRHGGLTPHMIFLRGDALTALYPRCRAAELIKYQ